MRPLREKLDKLFAVDPVVEELSEMLLGPDHGFRGEDDLRDYLSEGALLNVGRIASKALSIPCGEYMVWATNAGHTMLVPVSDAHRPQHQEVFENSAQSNYEVLTPSLLSNWRTVERSVHIMEQTNPEGGQFGSKERDEQQKQTGIDTSIKVATVDRTSILRAMEDMGMTETQLANEVGVGVPTISRILREPADVQGDPGGRDPSVGLAAEICRVLRLDPTAAFPDIFGPQSDAKPRKPPANRGSGMKNRAHGSTKKGRATKLWTKGNK